jgi:hypothetical protein
MDSPDERQQETERDLEDVLSEQFDRMEAEDSAEQETEEDAEVAVSEEETAEGTQEAAEASEETDEVSDEEVSEEPTEEEIDEALEAVDYNEPAPERWPEELKTVYNELPPQAKKAMLEGIFKPMQRQYTKETTELAQMKKNVEPMLQVLNQHRNDFERMGVNPVEAFRQQVAWAAHFARVGPEKGLKDMQAAYGQEQPDAGQEQDEYLTPVERALKTKLESIEKGLNERQQNEQLSQQQARQQAHMNWARQVNDGVQSFISEQKDGKPAHPHVESVAPAIAGLIRGGLVNRVDEYGQPVPVRDQIAQAYKMACDMNPSIRGARQDAGQVARAKAAQDVGVVTKLPSDHSGVDSELDISSFIESTYDRLNRRSG